MALSHSAVLQQVPRLPSLRKAVVSRAASNTEPVLRKPELIKPVRPVIDEETAEFLRPSPSEKPEAEQQASADPSVITVEFQRAQAKAMLQYFKDLAVEERAETAKLFGWTKKNEIRNGRWVMFGFAVGLLTEYATGVDFPNQLKLLVSYLGIADIYD